MRTPEEIAITNRIALIRELVDDSHGLTEFFEAANLAISVLHDTVGGSHPLFGTLDDALKKAHWEQAVAAARTVATLYDQGVLKSPRLRIAHEIEGDLLDIAQTQVTAAEKNGDAAQKQTQLAIAAFLAGATLEDAMRRLCDARSIPYDAQKTSLAKLQMALYQPSTGISIFAGPGWTRYTPESRSAHENRFHRTIVQVLRPSLSPR